MNYEYYYRSVELSPVERKARNLKQKRLLSSPKCPYRLWGLSSLLFSVYQGSFPDLQRLGRKIKPSLPSSAEVQNKWNNASTSPCALLAWTQKTSLFYFA